MYGAFNLSIRMDNDAMKSNEDIARALREVAHQLEEGRDTGGIMDDNGNSVGRFEFEKWSETAAYDNRRDG